MKSKASLGPYRSILEVFVFADNREILGLVPVLECADIGAPRQARKAIQQSPTFSISHFDDLYRPMHLYSPPKCSYNTRGLA